MLHKKTQKISMALNSFASLRGRFDKRSAESRGNESAYGTTWSVELNGYEIENWQGVPKPHNFCYYGVILSLLAFTANAIRPVQLSLIGDNEISIVEEGNFEVRLSLDQKMTKPFKPSTIEFDQIQEFVNGCGFGYVPKFSFVSIEMDDYKIPYLTYWHFINEIQGRLTKEIDEHARFIKKLNQVRRKNPVQTESDEPGWEIVEIPLEELISFNAKEVIKIVRKSDQMCIFLMGVGSGGVACAYGARYVYGEYQALVQPSDSSSYLYKIALALRALSLLW